MSYIYYDCRSIIVTEAAKNGHLEVLEWCSMHGYTRFS